MYLMACGCIQIYHDPKKKQLRKAHLKYYVKVFVLQF